MTFLQGTMWIDACMPLGGKRPPVLVRRAVHLAFWMIRANQNANLRLKLTLCYQHILLGPRAELTRSGRFFASSDVSVS